MAWKEFSELSKSDQLHELKRQAMIVSQSSLDRATQIVMGLGGCGLDPFTLENVKKRIKETAEDLNLFVYSQAEILTVYKSEPKELPKPTPKEKKVLDKIVEKLGGIPEDVVYGDVLEWTQEVYGKKVYPKNIESIDKFIKWLEEKK